MNVSVDVFGDRGMVGLAAAEIRGKRERKTHVALPVDVMVSAAESLRLHQSRARDQRCQSRADHDCC